MADDEQQTSEQVEATEPEPTVTVEPTPEPVTAVADKPRGYNFETGEFVV